MEQMRVWYDIKSSKNSLGLNQSFQHLDEFTTIL